MQTLDLKPSHAAVKKYYDALSKLAAEDAKNEGNVENAFIDLLNYCAKKMGQNWLVIPKRALKITKNKEVVPDATIVSEGVTRGYWEAKDSKDKLDDEIKAKFAVGYPKDNILFWEPLKICLWQNGTLKFGTHPIDVANADNLVHALKEFFEYSRPHIEHWEKAVEEFKQQVPKLAELLKGRIEKERKANKPFIAAFESFYELCKQAINPNLDVEAVEGMLIQHLLVERIFSKVFDDPDFVRRNVIAAEIEKVIATLTFNRQEFLRPYNYFYVALEENAANAKDYTEKQTILNTVYERFFQGWSVKEADTLGIVYTPQPIVDFMVHSVEEILRKEFGRALSDEDVHILDPFVGTGNFILRVMRAIASTKLGHKYENELHCNEVMLMPYYIACMNIEHEYRERTGQHKAFPGICLVDTFELAEAAQISMFTAENTERVERQKRSPITVIIGNPPYNTGQKNENENNKNRKYTNLDKRIRDTYKKDSKAQLKSKYDNPYVRAMRWASDRLSSEGVIALVTHHSFATKNVFDGLRANLQKDFDRIYILDLGGSVKDNPKLSGTKHNVFGIQDGVSINFFVRTGLPRKGTASIFYSRLTEDWTKEERYNYLNASATYGAVSWQNDWPKPQLFAGFAESMPLVDEKGIFGASSGGVSTNRDAVVYNFSRDILLAGVGQEIKLYNQEVARWRVAKNANPKLEIDKFVDNSRVKWSEHLKKNLASFKIGTIQPTQTRKTYYRPFCSLSLYLDSLLVDRPSLVRNSFPTPQSELHNLAICFTAKSSGPFHSIAGNRIFDLHCTGDSRLASYYLYDEDGSNRRENITDWALEQFRTHYKDKKITKWDIFHYTYGVLHDPEYRERYAANLKRELPRIPYAPDFHAYAKAGKRLAEIHVEYEKQKPYKLEEREKKGKFNWRVEKMRLSKDKTMLTYNDSLTLSGIPAEVYEYRLGNRSALEWVVDQYQVSEDKRSGILNDPNREDDPEYIYRLIGQVITVSLETVKIVKSLPGLGLPAAETKSSAAVVQ